MEEKDKELAQKVAQATLDQIKMKVEADMDILRAVVPTKEREAHETALDVKYLAQRQRTGG